MASPKGFPKFLSYLSSHPSYGATPLWREQLLKSSYCSYPTCCQHQPYTCQQWEWPSVPVRVTGFPLNPGSSWVPDLVRHCKMSWVLINQSIFKNTCTIREDLIVSIMLWAEGKHMMCRSLGRLILMACKGEWVGQPLGSLQTVFQVLWQQLMCCSVSVSQGLSLMGTWWSSLPSSQWTPSVLGRVTWWSS